MTALPAYMLAADQLEVDELIRLCRLAQAGDIRARNKAVQANISLVLDVAAGVARRHGRTDLEDLVQEGTMGLLCAVERWDPDRGCFSTFAVWWIRSRLQSYTERDSTIRGPTDRPVRRRFLAEHGRGSWATVPLHVASAGAATSPQDRLTGGRPPIEALVDARARLARQGAD